MGFVTASDMAVAGAFYGDLLGLQRVESSPIADVYDVSGAKLCVVHVDHVEASLETSFGWKVRDLGATTAKLRAAGVELISYPGLEQDADLAWTSPSGSRVAWFQDPAGHVLSLIQSAA